MSYFYENEDLLRSTRATYCAPSFASFEETAIYIAEAAERDFNELFMEVGISELAVFESTGSMIIYEEGETEKENGFKKIKDKVVKFFQKRWADIKGAFEKLINKIKEKINEAKVKFRDSALSKIDWKLIPDNFGKGKNGKEEKIHTFGAAKILSDDATKAGAGFIGEIKSRLEGLEADKVEEVSKDLQENLIKDTTGYDAKDVEELKKAIKDAFDKEVEPYNKGFANAGNYKDAIDIVINCVGEMNIAKSSYNDLRKLLDSAIKEVKKSHSKDIKSFKPMVSLMKDAINVVNASKGAFLSCERVSRSEAMRFIRDVFKTQFKKSKSVGESTYVYSRQLDLIDEAFDW